MRAFLVQGLKIDETGQIKWRFNIDSIYNNWNELGQGHDSLVANKEFTAPTCFIGGGNSPYLR